MLPKRYVNQPTRSAPLGDGHDEGAVADHYAHDDLEGVLLAELTAAGFDTNALTVRDLAPVDEFHICGLEASEALLRHLPDGPECRVLDIGCGIGGSARFFAERLDCQVVGIDLTPSFVEVAKRLTERVGLGGRVSFEAASALDLPFQDASFDCETLLHVGMNIDDKRGLFAEAARVLRPDAPFVVYDVMRLAPGELPFPLPWSSRAETSFVASPEDYRRTLAAVGFDIKMQQSWGSKGQDFFRRQRERMAGGGGGLNLRAIMGQDLLTKVANMYALVEADILASVEMIAIRSSA